MRRFAFATTSCCALIATAAAWSVFAPAAVAATPPTVEIKLDDSGASARLVFSHSRRVTRAVIYTGGRIEVLYAEPVIVEPERMRLDGKILAGWETVDRTRVVLEPGPDYARYEAFDLRNPERLILDLQGRRPEVSGIVRGARPDPDRTVVVIDPGHGGSEFGAAGPKGLLEKEVTLDLARRLKSVLQQDPSLSVVLTRDADHLVDLDERTAIANHNRADLFLSIHLNSSPRRSAYGAETYFLSPAATDDDARTLAAMENRTFDSQEKLPAAEGAGPGSLDLVLWDLAQNRYLEESSALGEAVQRHLNRLTGTRNRGVRQAPFRVLMGATMPAVLVEVGFISNPEEEERFRGLSYRNRVVEAVANAVTEFLDRLEQLSAPDGSVAAGANSP